MPTTIASSTYPAFAAAAGTIIRRLANAHGEGGMLVGMRTFGKVGATSSTDNMLWRPPLLETLTDDRMPCVRVRGLAATVVQLGPALSALREGSAQSRLNKSKCYAQQIQVSVISPVKDGIMQPDTTNRELAVPGHLDWVAMVMDAIETDDLGTEDGSLDRSSITPMEMSVLPAETESEHYYESVITVSVVTKPLFLGQHSCPLGE